jgi:hypothetical protein
MKRFTLVLFLVAGCAATNVAAPDAKLRQLEESRREIAARAKRCVSAAMKLSAHQTSSTTQGDSSIGQKGIARGDRDREISKCKATEARENDELFAQERDEYLLQAQQEHDNATLITILSTSRPH